MSGCPSLRISRCRTLIEIALIFAVFAIQGAWPAPDVNEPYYLGKAIHYWNPDWLRGDFFMESADTHKVFYFTFGWLSLWLSPVALVWTGRILTWLLLAWAWRRLNVAVVPRPWCSVLTAALFACLMDRCHMAGEWVIGGVEAKGFAYVFVFLGLESLVRNRWNRALLLFGAASAFHALVGGWAAAAAGVAWLIKPRPVVALGGATTGRGFMGAPLRSLWPGIVGGLLLALPGLLPSLTLDWGVDPQIKQQAHQIYVFERLPHHLVLTGIRTDFILRLALLWCFWMLLGRYDRLSSTPSEKFLSPPNAPPLQWGGGSCRQETSGSRTSLSYLRAFVTGAVILSLVGVAIHAIIFVDRALAADLLRYYWFRMTDVALPLGVALEGVAIIVAKFDDANGRRRTAAGYCWLSLAILVAAFHVSDRAIDRVAPPPPRSHKTDGFEDYTAWRAACEWVANSGKIPPDARFLTPRLAQTFKWYTGRSDVATWKDVPQDAQAIVQWWDRIKDIYATGLPPPDPRWREPIAEVGAERLKQLGAKYEADYAIAQLTDPILSLPVVYYNDRYIIYHLSPEMNGR